MDNVVYTQVLTDVSRCRVDSALRSTSEVPPARAVLESPACLILVRSMQSRSAISRPTRSFSGKLSAQRFLLSRNFDARPALYFQHGGHGSAGGKIPEDPAAQVVWRSMA